MQLPARPAILLPEKSFGVQLLQREQDVQGISFGQSNAAVLGDAGKDGIRLYVREGVSLAGSDRCVEEVAVLGKRVAWTCGSRVRKMFTLGSEVLQAAWARFPGYSDDPVLCLLSASCLTTCTLGGELQECAVPPGLDAVWAAGEAGVLLGGSSASTLYLLSHPMEEPQPVVADVSLRAGRRGVYAGWSGEQVVWAADDLPYVATYSEAAGRLAVWSIGRAAVASELLGDLPDIPAATPLGGLEPATLGPLSAPAGAGVRSVAAAAGVTPMSIFSFQPQGGVMGAGGAGGGGPVSGSAGGVAAMFGGAAAARNAAASAGAGMFAFPQQHQWQQQQQGFQQQYSPQQVAPTPYPPSAARSDVSMMAITPAPVAQPAAAAAGAAAAASPPSTATSDMSMAISPASVATPSLTQPPAGSAAGHPGGMPGPTPHPAPQPTPVAYPPSAALSDMSITPMSITPAPGAGGPAVGGPQPSPVAYPPSAAPSDVSMMAITPAVPTMLQHLLRPPASHYHLQQQQQMYPLPQYAQQHQQQVPGASPEYPHSVARSDMSMASLPLTGATPLVTPAVAGFPGPGGAAGPAGPLTAAGMVGGRPAATAGPGRYLAPHFGTVAGTPGAAGASPWGGGAAASPGVGLVGASGAVPGSALKRTPAARTPDGFLSPHLFSARPRAETAAVPFGHSGLASHPHSQRPLGTPAAQPLRMMEALEGGAGGRDAAPATPWLAGGATPGGPASHLSTTRWLATGDTSGEVWVMVLLHEEAMQPGCRPTEAVMATDLSGSPLLCVLCRQQARLLAFSITPSSTAPSSAGIGIGIGTGDAVLGRERATPAPSLAAGGGVSGGGCGVGGGVKVALAGSLEALAVAAVEATRSRITDPCSPLRVHRDLLVLLPSRELVLHRGLAPLFAVSFCKAGAPALAGGTSGAPSSSTAARTTAGGRTGTSHHQRSTTATATVGPLAGAVSGLFNGGAATAGAEPSTPASQAGTDMVMDDDDSDMEQDSDSSADDEETRGNRAGVQRGGGGGGRATAIAAAVPGPGPVASSRLGAVTSSSAAAAVAASDHPGDGATSDADDMMLISSPPMTAATAAAAALVPHSAKATWKAPPPGGAGGGVSGGGGPAVSERRAVVGLRLGISNTVVLLLASPTSAQPVAAAAAAVAASTAPAIGDAKTASEELRLLLPFATLSPLAASVLDVVRATAPADLYLTLLRRVYSRPAAGTNRPAAEWAAVADALLEWAADPAGFADAARLQQLLPAPVGSTTTASRGDGSSSSGGAGGGGGLGGAGGSEPPVTPFSTPLHTRRFAAMSLASPAHPPRPQPLQPHHPHHQLHPQGPVAVDDRHQRQPPSHLPARDSAPAAAASDHSSAWERMLASSTQAQLLSGRRRPAWMVPRDPWVTSSDAAAAHTAVNPLKSVQALLGPAFGAAAAAAAAYSGGAVDGGISGGRPAPPLGAAAQPLLTVLYGLHGLYEELKLDVLSWPHLQPLGTCLAAAASALGLHPYWEHYARDVGPAALRAAGVAEPPLQGPPGPQVLRPPADIHRVLSRMVCGTPPEPADLPSLLDPTQMPGTGGTATAAGAAGGSISPTGTTSHPALPLTSRLLAAYGLLCDCARSCATIMLNASLQATAAAATASAFPGGPAAAAAAADAASPVDSPVPSLEAAVRAASEQVVALVAAQGWDAGSLGRLPPGVALPLREAFQRCRAAPPAGWPVQAYALIGREDIAATLAPSGITTGGPTAAAATAADKRQHDSHAQQQQGEQQQQPQSAIATGGPSPAPASVFSSMLRNLSGLRTPHPADLGAAGVANPDAVTPTAIAGAGVGAGSGVAISAGGLPNTAGAAGSDEPNSASTTAGGGADGGSSSLGMSPASSLFSFRALPQFSLAAVTPTTATSTGGGVTNITPYGVFNRNLRGSGGGGAAAATGAARHPPSRRRSTTSAGGATVAAASGDGALVPVRRPSSAATAPPPPPPRPLPSHLWHLWRPAYTARLQLPSHQLDLGAELETPRKLEGPAKQFESKHGMEGLMRGVSRLRFGRDGRLHEVIGALDSSHPLLLDGLGLHEADPEAPTKQQQQLLAAALRTMSLPLGRGAVALATGRPLPTEPTASVPSMCLAGLVPDSLAGHTVVNLDLSTAQPAPGGGAAADFTAWPEFHNGAAEGLRLSSGGAESLARGSLLVATKPDIPSYTHAGLLMALGLTGHLSRLSGPDIYRYLSDEHAPTTIAVLLGMAAQRRGSMDAAVKKMLFVHLPARHPTSYPELELSPLVQAAALLGVGLLYEASAHRVMAETLLEEIGRRPLSPAAAAAFAADAAGGGRGAAGAARGTGGPGGGGLGGAAAAGAALPPGASPLAVTHDREGYALAAGMALGMVVLGLGGSRAAAGLADLQLEERLTYYMLGSTDASAAARRAGGVYGAAGASSHYYAGGTSGLDRVFGPGPGGAKLGHAVALWGGDPAGPAALPTPTAAGRSAEGPGAQTAAGNGQGVASLVLEPDNMLNRSITSPAATVALALMYLRTNDTTIAARFQLPDTPFGLDSVRPDCITLRALGRALVMWDEVEPCGEWIAASMPPLFRGPLERLIDRVVAHIHQQQQQQAAAVAAGGTPGHGGAAAGAGGRFGGLCGADVHAVALAHVSALAGLCLAIGLKYAGSANSRAYETLRSVALSLLAAKRRLPEVAPSSTATGGAAVVTGAGQVAGGGPGAVGRLDRAPVEAALSVVALALSVVMAGTGHLPTFHLLQCLSHRRHPTQHHVLHGLGVGYGAHCAISLALGFLFLGAGTHTFSSSNSAVAALVVSLYPVLPHTPTDNRCHLQVFRHLYVLAARRRCLEAVDIDSQQLVYVPLQLAVQPPRVERRQSPAQQQQQRQQQEGAGGGLQQRQGRGRSAGGTAEAGGGGGRSEGGVDSMVEDSVLRTSTKANLPWTPDGQLRPGPGLPLPLPLSTAATATTTGTGIVATAVPGSSTAAAAAVTAAGGAAGGGTASGGGASAASAPMLEALHLEGDSPGPGPGSLSLVRSPAKAPGPAGAAAAATAPGAQLAGGANSAADVAARVGQTLPAGQQQQQQQPSQLAVLDPATGAVVPAPPLMTYERVAPALLPEPHQIVSLAVRGPRYWPQQLDWSSRGGGGGAEGAASSSDDAPVASGSAAAGLPAAGMGVGASHPVPYTPLPGGAARAGTSWAAQRSWLTAVTPGAALPALPGGPHAHHQQQHQHHHHHHQPVAAAGAAAGGGAGPATSCVGGVVLGRGSGGGAGGGGVVYGSGGSGGSTGSALETVYRQLLLFVKKRAGSLSYSQDPSGIRSLLSRAFHNQSMLRSPLELSAGHPRRRAVVAPGDEGDTSGAKKSPAGGLMVGRSTSPSQGARTRRQLDWRGGGSGSSSGGGGASPVGQCNASPLGRQEAGNSYNNNSSGGGAGGRAAGMRGEALTTPRGGGARMEHGDRDYSAPSSGRGSGDGSASTSADDREAPGRDDDAATTGADSGGVGGGFDIAYLCATFSVDPSIMGFAQHIQTMRDLWLATEAAAEAGGGAVHGLRRGLVLLAPAATRGANRRQHGQQQQQEEEQQRLWRQRRRHGADLLSFCYSALYECINGEKTVALPMYLHLHCLVHRAACTASAVAPPQGSRRALPLPPPPPPHVNASGRGGDASAGPAYTGSLLTGPPVPLTTALRGLQLARSYYSGPLAAAAAAAAAAPGGDVFGDPDEQALWRPLLQPAFLDSLWSTLQHRRWRPLGLLPPSGVGGSSSDGGRGGATAAAGRSALEAYLRRGQLLDADDFESVVSGVTQLASEPELQEELVRVMALHHLPPLATLEAALTALRALPAWQQLRQLAAVTAGMAAASKPGQGQDRAKVGAGGAKGAAGSEGVAPSWAVLPLLSLVLPGLSQEAALLLAAAVSM